MLRLVLISPILFLLFTACSSKKAATEKGNLTGDSAISNEPMNFDPQGSDSQKITGLSTIHFDFDKALLSKKDRDTLIKDAEWIKSHPGTSIQIEGHCDIKGSQEYNLALGEQRAKVALDYLVNLGIDKSRLTMISYGKEKPLTTDDSEEAQAKNRRDNFVPLSVK